MRLMMLLLLLSAPVVASAQTFAGGCRAEGEEVICTATLPGQPGQRISAWGMFRGTSAMLGEVVGSVSDCQGTSRGLGTLTQVANQGTRLLFVTQVERGGAHCLRVVIRRCALEGVPTSCALVAAGTRFEGRLR